MKMEKQIQIIHSENEKIKSTLKSVNESMGIITELFNQGAVSEKTYNHIITEKIYPLIKKLKQQQQDLLELHYRLTEKIIKTH